MYMLIQILDTDDTNAPNMRMIGTVSGHYNAVAMRKDYEEQYGGQYIIVLLV